MDEDSDAAGVIVVGVDGSDGSLEALRWAAAQAEATGDTLEVLMAWEWPNAWGRTPAWPPGQDPADQTTRLLAEAVDRALGPRHSPPVHQVVVEGHPASALIAASEHAALLVVGSRGLGGFAGLMLGSVTQHCTTHAACPVVVVRHRPTQSD